MKDGLHPRSSGFKWEEAAMNFSSMTRWCAHIAQRHPNPKPRRRLALAAVLAAATLGALPLRGQVPAASPEGDRLEELQTQAKEALKARHWQEAVPLLKQVVGLAPGRWEAFQGLGNAYLNLGRYQEAIDAYEAGVALCQAELAGGAPKDRQQAALGQMFMSEGNAFFKLGKPQSALARYTKAAEVDPNPGQAYFNLAATLYNQGQMEGAVSYCDKAIATDPKRADAYFIKGSALFGNSRLDAKNQLVAPPGTREALEQYLKLAPTGGHAADAKAMLDAMGVMLETTFKPKGR
jgi:tetratricopeptide (TPR) repeat protein